MGGGPSQIDTWDPKPSVTRLNGQDVPESVAGKVPMNRRLRLSNLYACPFEFKQYGQSGLQVSDLFKETARHVDDICVLRSMRHNSPIHTPAEYIALTGSITGIRPTLGAWLSRGCWHKREALPAPVRNQSFLSNPADPQKA